MKKAVLLYNPDSGGSRGGNRQSELESIVALLRGEKVDAKLVLTDSPADAAQQARQAASSGCDTVFACGGDGTIHSVVQGLVQSSAALAVLPMGTANALAHDLGLPLNLRGAARVMLRAVPRRIAVGRVDFIDLKYQPGSRYFVVAAGAGVDAHLFYKLHTGTKKRMGMTAYYAKAWQLWCSYPMTRFEVEFKNGVANELHRASVTELMAVRIQNFGGVLQELAPGASLDRNDVRVVACSTANRWSYLSYVTRGFLHGKWKVSGIDLAYSDRVLCKYSGAPSSGAGGAQRKIYVETDGELVGTLPAEITVVPNALTLLQPTR